MTSGKGVIKTAACFSVFVCVRKGAFSQEFFCTKYVRISFARYPCSSLCRFFLVVTIYWVCIFQNHPLLPQHYKSQLVGIPQRVPAKSIWIQTRFNLYSKKTVIFSMLHLSGKPLYVQQTYYTR